MVMIMVYLFELIAVLYITIENYSPEKISRNTKPDSYEIE